MDVSGQLQALTALPLKRESPVIFGQRMGGPESQFGRYGDEKDLLLLLEIEPQFLGRPVRSRSLRRLSCM
jgi:hypothetical protein